MSERDEIRYVVGDATSPQAPGPAVIAHVCNDVGGWGRGFVTAISARWPEPERQYRAWYRGRSGNDFALGAIQLVSVGPDLWVANMIGQRGVRRSGGKPPIRYDAIERALTTLSSRSVEMAASVHMPRIGCGLAGGDWSEIEPLILGTLVVSGVPTTVYDLANGG